MTDKLTEVHGEGNCHICGKPRREPQGLDSFCSYPHGMVPVEPIDKDKPEGCWSWMDGNLGGIDDV